MGTNYTRGRQFEYRVRRYLTENGWVVFRSAGSHSPADLVALQAGEVLLVQCKANGHMAPAQRVGLVELARELGVMPVVAYKQGRQLVLAEVKEDMEGKR